MLPKYLYCGGGEIRVSCSVLATLFSEKGRGGNTDTMKIIIIFINSCVGRKGKIKNPKQCVNVNPKAFLESLFSQVRKLQVEQGRE